MALARRSRSAAAPAGSAGDGAYRLQLSGGGSITLSAGSSTALVGADGAELLAQLSQEPRAALLLPDRAAPLHPGYSIGHQISDAVSGTRRAALDEATDLLEATGVPEPHERVKARPHELNILDRQRAQLALALVNRPRLVLADDPGADLANADAAAFGAAVGRLQAKFGYTLVVAAPQQRTVVRLVQEILVVGDGRVLERRRRQPAA